MKCCYPGTFDPITKGHLDIIERASNLFDETVVLIMRNPKKKCIFSEEERKSMIEKSIADLPNAHKISVVIGSGLTVQFAKKIGAQAIIRGIRAVSDYEYELLQATANMTLDDTIETMLLIARPEYSFLSSSVVKEIAENDGDISGMMPEAIIDEVKEKMVSRLQESIHKLL